MKLHLPITLRRTLLSLLLPVAGISPSMGTDLFSRTLKKRCLSVITAVAFIMI